MHFFIIYKKKYCQAIWLCIIGVLNWNYKSRWDKKKMVFRDVKIRKATKVKKIRFPKKILEWFGPRLFDTISFNKDGVINQRKLVFKKKIAHKLSWLKTNLPWFTSQEQAGVKISSKAMKVPTACFTLRIFQCIRTVLNTANCKPQCKLQCSLPITWVTCWCHHHPYCTVNTAL